MPGPYDSRDKKVNEVKTYDVFGSHNQLSLNIKLTYFQPGSMNRASQSSRGWTFVRTQSMIASVEEPGVKISITPASYRAGRGRGPTTPAVARSSATLVLVT